MDNLSRMHPVPAPASDPYNDAALKSGDQKAFEEMLEGRGMHLSHILRLGLTSLLDPLSLMLSMLPGPSGYALRRAQYKITLGSLGKNCLLDQGLRITGHKNITVGDYTWIDRWAAIHALFGPITIGKRIHISPYCIVTSGPDGTELQDYTGLSSNVHIYGHTQAPVKGKRMSGPMIPWRYKAWKTAKVVLERDSFVGAFSMVLPGVTIGEGAVVGAHSLVNKDVAPWTIVGGSPAKVIGHRDKVDVPEL